MRVAIQCALGIVFVAAAGAKLRHPFAFARAISTMHLLPASIAYVAALALLPVEAAIGVAHLTNLFVYEAAWIGIALLSTFAIALTILLRRGDVVGCQCFGTSSEDATSWRSIVRVLVMLVGEVVVLTGILNAHGPEAIRPYQSADVVVHALILLFAAIWCLDAPSVVSIIKRQHCRTCTATVPESNLYGDAA